MRDFEKIIIKIRKVIFEKILYFEFLFINIYINKTCITYKFFVQITPRGFIK